MRRNFRPRKKVDPFVKDPSKVIDYKDIETLKRFISDRGKISKKSYRTKCETSKRNYKSNQKS